MNVYGIQTVEHYHAMIKRITKRYEQANRDVKKILDEIDTLQRRLHIANGILHDAEMKVTTSDNDTGDATHVGITANGTRLYKIKGIWHSKVYTISDNNLCYTFEPFTEE